MRHGYKRRPPWVGAHARAGGAGTSQGQSTRWISCRSPSAGSNTGCGTTSAANPRARWTRGAWSPSGGLATVRMALPAARHCELPPRSSRSHYCVASWRGPCGRQQGCPATACGPTSHAPIAVRRTRTRSTSCGIAWSGGKQGRYGGIGRGKRQQPSPSSGRPTGGRPASRCLQGAGLFPLWLAQGVDRALLDKFVYRLYGMYPAVLATRIAANREDQASRPAASAAPQPLPLEHLCGPPPGGCGPQPPVSPVRGPAGLAVALGFYPRLGPVGTGASIDAGASGSFLGRACPGLQAPGVHIVCGACAS